MKHLRKNHIDIPHVWEAALVMEDARDIDNPRHIKGAVSSTLRSMAGTPGFDPGTALYTRTSVYGRQIIYLSVGFTQAEHDERILDFLEWPNPEDNPKYD